MDEAERCELSAENLTYRALYSIIEAAVDTGRELRQFWMVCDSLVHSSALQAAKEAWQYQKDNFHRDAAILGYLAASGAGDCLYLILGKGPFADTRHHGLKPAGIWYAAKRAAKRYKWITGRFPAGAMPPKPAGAGCGVSALLLAAAGVGLASLLW